MANVCTASSITIASVKECIHDLKMQRIGTVVVKEILFRDESEIDPFFVALSEKYRLKLGYGIDGAPLPCMPPAILNIPVRVDPSLQGPSPKLVKGLA